MTRPRPRSARTPPRRCFVTRIQRRVGRRSTLRIRFRRVPPVLVWTPAPRPGSAVAGQVAVLTDDWAVLEFPVTILAEKVLRRNDLPAPTLDQTRHTGEEPHK